MAFLIGGANSATGGYDIDNSLRINDADNAYLSFTPDSDGDLDKWTLSMWVKGTPVGGYAYTFTVEDSGGGNNTVIVFYNDDGVRFEHYDGSQLGMLITNRKLRDPSAWYHLVFVWDTGNGTPGNRQRMYINGVEETSFATDTNPSSGRVSFVNDASHEHWIGRGITQSEANNFDGYLAEVAFCDGQTYSASDFGEYNSNGVWVPKKLGVTFGTQGYYLEFKETGTSANASGIGADTSGNTNHWAVTNLVATDITTDTPTNSFCTLNPLNDVAITYSEGNLHAINNGAAGSATGTMAPSNGKWYVEMELAGISNFAAGVINLDTWPSMTNIYPYAYSAMVLIENSANYNVTYGNTASSPSTLQTGTQLAVAKYGFAIDIDENDLYVSANGNWYTGSAFDDTDFSNATAVTTDLPSGVPLTFCMRNPSSIARCNFGNAAGADSIASGNADANGYGNFEYAVPSGYFSLCTKNLAEYG